MSPKEMDIRRLRRLLRETARIAEHASLTGSLEKGSRLAIRQYNAIRDHLENIEAVPESLFPELDEDEDGFDELGVAAKLLENYLEDDPEDAPAPPKEKSRHLEFKFGTGSFEDAGDLRNLRNIGEILRSHLPEILRDHVHPVPPVPPTPPTPPVPPVPPTASASPVSPEVPPISQEAAPVPLTPLDEERLQQRATAAAMDSLIERLKDPTFSPDERATIAAEFVRLAQLEQ